jgi:type IV fimbrial biogenesis protein FimT
MIEMAIVIVIIGILTALGMPTMSDVMRDNRVRSIAERFADGLGRARIEAIQRNTTVSFTVDDLGWQIALPDPGGGAATPILSLAAPAADAGYSAAAAQPQILFSGNGRASIADFSIDLGHSGGSCEADGGEVRCLRLTVSTRGAIRMCDPATGNGDPRACN